MTVSPAGVPVPSLPLILSPVQKALIHDRLPSWAANAVIPDEFVWAPSRSMPGVAHAKPLHSDPQTGSVAIPIYMSPGVFYAEHIHVPLVVDGILKGEDVIFLSGMLQDAQGRYDTDQNYVQVPWSIHTPQAVGDEPAVFIGIAHGGVIATGLPGTGGADLLKKHSVSPERMGGAIFTGIRPDANGDPTRKVVAAKLFKGLEGFRAEESAQVESWLDLLERFSPDERIDYMRRVFPECKVSGV